MIDPDNQPDTMNESAPPDPPRVGRYPHAEATDERHSGLLDPLLDSSEHGLLGGLIERAAPTEHAHHPPSADDPWAHRRGEPRVFALMLSLYLLGAALLTIFSAPTVGVTSSSTFQFAVRALLALVALASVVIWPLTRLSQASPKNSIAAALADVVVVSLLTQAAIWPATILPGGSPIPPIPWLGLWSWRVAAGMTVMLFAWSLLIGAMIACGTVRTAAWERTGWMVLILVVTTGFPVAALIAPRLHLVPPDELFLASALTGVMRLPDAPSGLTANMTNLEWIFAVAPALLSAPVWILAWARQRAMR